MFNENYVCIDKNYEKYSKNHPELASKLKALCKKVREEIDTCVYTPEPEVLMTFLNLLSEHKINYETDYDNQIENTHPNSNGK